MMSTRNRSRISIRRKKLFGEYLTPRELFRKYIEPEIKDLIYEYVWVDLFAGEGDLILPILNLVPMDRRIDFFAKHIYLFDIQSIMVERAIEKASRYGIPRHVAEKNIIQRDTLLNYPKFIFEKDLPIYHITNPPYLYIGYIAKHEETHDLLKYFSGENKGYQDLYQVALANDMRHGVEKMIYVIPTNFFFGYSVSNKIRRDLLKIYIVKKVYFFEKQIFRDTGTNVAICFFERKKIPGQEPQIFEGYKVTGSGEMVKRRYILRPENNYRAGDEFNEFVKRLRSSRPLRIKFYLTLNEVSRNRGDYAVEIIDANSYSKGGYSKRIIYVNKELYDKIRSNILFVKTLDTGSLDGRAGLYVIRDLFGVDGILVTKAPYRTHPIQIFIEPRLSEEEQILLMKYFNLILEYLRELTDSEFMTTYKYSNSLYTRKYLGLEQVKKLIETFPWLELDDSERRFFRDLVLSGEVSRLLEFLRKRRSII